MRIEKIKLPKKERTLKAISSSKMMILLEIIFPILINIFRVKFSDRLTLIYFTELLRKNVNKQPKYLSIDNF